MRRRNRKSYTFLTVYGNGKAILAQSLLGLCFLVFRATLWLCFTAPSHSERHAGGFTKDVVHLHQIGEEVHQSSNTTHVQIQQKNSLANVPVLHQYAINI